MRLAPSAWLIGLAAATALLIWAGTPVVTKVAVARVDALTVGVLRTVLSAAVLAPLLVFAGARLPRPKGAGPGLLLAVSTAGGFVAFPLLFSLGVERTSAGHAALVVAAAPIFTGLFAALLERRRPARPWWLGVALAFLGEYVLIGGRQDLGAEGASLSGDVLVLLACGAAAAGYVAGGRLAQSTGTWAATAWSVSLGGAVLMPLLIWRGEAVAWSDIGAADWLSIAYLALLSSVIAYACWYWALGQGGIARVGASQFLQPLLSVALAVVFLGEAVTPPIVAASALILSGVALARRPRASG